MIEIVQRTIPIGIPVALTSTDVELTLGEDIDWRFVRANLAITDSGATSWSPALVLKDASGAVLGIWPAFHPAGGAAVGVSTNAHINMDSTTSFKAIGATIVGGITFAQVEVPENLIVLAKQKLFFRAIGVTSATPGGPIVFTAAYAQEVDD